MHRTITASRSLNDLLKDKSTWPRSLRLNYVLSYRIVTSGLCANLREISFFYQEAESKGVADRVFVGILQANGMEQIRFAATDAFQNCNLGLLLYRSRVSETLVILKLIKFKGAAIGTLSKALNVSKLKSFSYGPAANSEHLSALLLLNMNPIAELEFDSMTTTKEAFFVKQAMKKWREKNFKYGRLNLSQTFTPTKWVHDFMFAEISRSLCKTDIACYPNFLKDGKLLWAETDSLVTLNQDIGSINIFLLLKIQLKMIEA